jgi:hypothetical protein
MAQEVNSNLGQDGRVSVNLRVDREKYVLLEQMRTTGFGLSKTERNRSDVYNEMLGYGLQINALRQELGGREFESVWKIIHNTKWEKFNLDQLEKYMAKEKK